MSRVHPLLKKWFLIFLAMVVVALTGAGVAVGALLGYVEELPRLDALEHYNPPEITRVFDRTGNTQLKEYFKERRELVRFSDIPEHVVNAFLAIEDERFYNHFGVDLKGIIRAFKANFESGEKVQGASTITMQVARNVVLQDRKKKLLRKVREIFTALQIERNYSKQQILEFYLNHIFFGWNMAYGVQAAAKEYFDKDVRDLTIPEAAMLAGLPKAPSRLSPFVNAEGARDRRNLVLGNMRKLNMIKTDEELKRYVSMPIVLNPPVRPKGEAPYYVDYVRSVMMEENSLRDSKDLGEKGYMVISAVDLQLQRIVEEELSKGLREVEKLVEEQKEERLGVEAEELGGVHKQQARLARIREVKDQSIIVNIQGRTGEVPLPEKLPYFNPSAIVKPGNLIDIYVQDIKPNGKLEAYLYDKTHVQGGAVLLDVKTGEILALSGGDDFDDPTNNGQFNRVTMNGRQPGSCWKPLLYGGAFDVNDDQGKPRFTPSYVEIDEPVTFPNGWSPKNYEMRHYGPTCLYEALVKSRNVPTVKLFMDIGPKKAVSLYHKYNLVHQPSDWDLPAIPAMALGTPDITPLELAAAYAVFANGGKGIKPNPIKRLYSSKNPSDSRVIKPQETQVLSPQAAYIMARVMQDVVNLGTAKTTVGKWIEEQKKNGRALPEIAGKTGTTNDCFVAWFCGYTPDLVLAIYVGYDQHRTMGPKVVGGRTVGPIWVPMMDRILQTRTDWKMKFDAPTGIEMRDICSKSGKLVTSACYASGQSVFGNAAFKAGTAPTGTCDYHGGSGYSSDGYGTPEEDLENQYQTGRNTSVGPAGSPYYQQQQQAPPGYYYPQQQQQQQQMRPQGPQRGYGYM